MSQTGVMQLSERLSKSFMSECIAIEKKALNGFGIRFRKADFEWVEKYTGIPRVEWKVNHEVSKLIALVNRKKMLGN